MEATAEPEPPRAAVVTGGSSVCIDSWFLDAAPSVRCVVSTGADVDHIDLTECARRGVASYTDVADYAVWLLLDVLSGRFIFFYLIDEVFLVNIIVLGI
jgi:hydroxypyruvate reductase 2